MEEAHFFDALHPVLYVFEGLLVCDVVHQDDALPQSERAKREDKRCECKGTERAQQHAGSAGSCAHHGSSVVGCRDGFEPLLPCRVPAQSARTVKKTEEVAEKQN